jgi:hypothetical protein
MAASRNIEADQEAIYLANQHEPIDEQQKRAIDKVLDGAGIQRRGRNYTYDYAAIPTNANAQAGEESGRTFSITNDKGDEVWFSNVMPQRTRELVRKYGGSEEDAKKFLAVHELVHKNCVASDLDSRAEEVYAWLAQALYNPRFALQVALANTDLAVVQNKSFNDQDFVIKAMQQAINDTFDRDIASQFLKIVDGARLEAKTENDKVTDRQVPHPFPQTVDKVLWEIAKGIAGLRHQDASKLYFQIYDALQQNFIDEMAAYLP